MTHRDALFDAWLSRMESLGGPDADFDQLSLRHWAKTIPRGPVLLVTFETLAEVFGRPGGFPVGHLVAEAQGWSHLALISDGTTWFRDPAVYRHFDHLVDDAFFEDFDRVVFYGAEASAHAAAAFSITATDATVLAVRPAPMAATTHSLRDGWISPPATAMRHIWPRGRAAPSCCSIHPSRAMLPMPRCSPPTT